MRVEIALPIAGAAALVGLFLWWRKRRRARDDAERILRGALETRPESMTEEQWIEFLLARLAGESGAPVDLDAGAPIRSFRDIVANPSVMRRASVVAAFDELFREGLLRRCSVNELVPRLFDDRRRHEVVQELRGRDAAEVGAALKAAFADARFLEPAKDSVRGEGVVDAAERLQSRATVPELSAIAQAASHPLRADAVEALARIGDAASAAIVAGALVSADEKVAESAVAGLDEPAVGTVRPRDPAFVDAIAEPLVAYVRTPRSSIAAIFHPPAKILMRLCGARAVPWLIGADVLRPDHPSARAVLDVLPPGAGPETAAAVRRLLDEFPGDAGDDQAAALAALGRLRHPDAESLAREALNEADETLRHGGAAALCALRGLVEHPGDVVFGAADLSLAQRLVKVALVYVAEVRNGGHEQYFFNSSGDDWHAAVDALTALRATELAACLREAVARFGRRPPSADRSPRQDALAKLTDGGASFDDLDRRVWAVADEFDTLVLLYILEHPEGFERS